jgi:hypothetical protein
MSNYSQDVPMLDPDVEAMLDAYEDMQRQVRHIIYDLDFLTVEECDVQRALHSLEQASQAMLDVVSAGSDTLYSNAVFQCLCTLAKLTYHYGEQMQLHEIDFVE